MSEIKRLRQIKGDHDYSLDSSFASRNRTITQTAYFKAGNFVVAIGELNRCNHWDDEDMEAAMAHLRSAWNEALKGAA